jgi:hypothetical protein
MDANTTFLDCPAYLDRDGTLRCGLPAEVEDRYALGSTDGAVTGLKIRCPRGHWFSGAVDGLTTGLPASAGTDRHGRGVGSAVGGGDSDRRGGPGNDLPFVARA